MTNIKEIEAWVFDRTNLVRSRALYTWLVTNFGQDTVPGSGVQEDAIARWAFQNQPVARMLLNRMARM
jgi:hypothetical protein